MSTTSNTNQLLSSLLATVRRAGYIATKLQGKVQNEGKPGQVFDDDPAALIAKRSAKTVVDEIVQEQILLTAAEVLQPSETRLDAEEVTPSTELFSRADEKVTLVVDPVDGTAEYINGLSNYSICVGVIEAEKVLIAIVYFAARDIVYFVSPDGAFFATSFYRSGMENVVRLVAQANSSNAVIYYNSRVPAGAVENLRSRGYTMIDDTNGGIGCPDAILKVASGDALAYISHSRQLRDILLGAILSRHADFKASDWTGGELRWPGGGRVPRAIFSPRSLPADVLLCLGVE